MKNIHVLPRDVTFEKTDKIKHHTDLGIKIYTKENDLKGNLSVYITSNEEIKSGDWFIRDGSIYKCFRIHETDIEFLTSIDSVYCGSNTFWSKEFCKKIILTTDQDLIADGVQAINDEFLQWFVKNPNCESVEIVDIRNIGIYATFLPYKIIIPKEEPFKHEFRVLPKEEVMVNRSNAYEFIDFDKKETLEEHKQTLHNTDHNIFKDFSVAKQETLEEFAQIVSPIQQIINFITENYEKDNEPRQLSMMLLKKWIELKLLDEESKWQIERSYSEEDMIEFGKYLLQLSNSAMSKKFNMKMLDSETGTKLTKDLFEQFKKK